MAKGYWIAHVTVTDPARYPDYVEMARGAFERYGARFLARGGDYENLEGEAGVRHVVIEFDSKEQALACYHSEQYQKAVKIRQAASTGTVTIVGGVE